MRYEPPVWSRLKSLNRASFTAFPGVGKGKGNKAGWCIPFKDGHGGCFGDWSTGLDEVWYAKPDKSRFPSEHAEHERKVKESKRCAIEERQRQYAEATKEAISIWKNAKLAKDNHPYLVRKGIKAHGMRLHEDERLIVPVCMDDEIISL